MTRRLQALVAAALLATFTSTPSDAARHQNRKHRPQVVASLSPIDQHAVGQPYYKGIYQQKRYPGPGRYEPRERRHIAHKTYDKGEYSWRRLISQTPHQWGGRSTSLAGVVAPLAAKIQEIVDACGSRVVSTHRPGARVRGTGHASLHARYPAEAVDIAGNYSCAYRHLVNWPGGYSVDPYRVKHLHISLASDQRERGIRFAHYSGNRHVRYARRHSRHRHYANAT